MEQAITRHDFVGRSVRRTGPAQSRDVAVEGPGPLCDSAANVTEPDNQPASTVQFPKTETFPVDRTLGFQPGLDTLEMMKRMSQDVLRNGDRLGITLAQSYPFLCQLTISRVVQTGMSALHPAQALKLKQSVDIRLHLTRCQQVKADPANLRCHVIGCHRLTVDSHTATRLPADHPQLWEIFQYPGYAGQGFFKDQQIGHLLVV